MSEALLVYATTHGHTARIASRVAAALEQDGVSVDLREVGDAREITAGTYDAVIVGASIHAGHHQRPVVDWVKRHAAALNAIPSSFFSVCLTAAEDTDEAREASQKYIDDFLDDTGWMPRASASFAGALQYREYDFATRLLMRLLMKRGHHPTDVSRDYDYTDWDAVERYGHRCAEMLAGAPIGA